MSSVHVASHEPMVANSVPPLSELPLDDVTIGAMAHSATSASKPGESDVSSFMLVILFPACFRFCK